MSGQPFKPRIEEHAKLTLLSTKADKDKSFYCSYPACKLGEKGKLQWLDVVCPACWGINRNEVKIIFASNFFKWSRMEEHFAKLRENHDAPTRVDAAICLLESRCDLLLLSDYHVSRCPGFIK